MSRLLWGMVQDCGAALLLRGQWFASALKHSLSNKGIGFTCLRIALAGYAGNKCLQTFFHFTVIAHAAEGNGSMDEHMVSRLFWQLSDRLPSLAVVQHAWPVPTRNQHLTTCAPDIGIVWSKFSDLTCEV